MMTRLFLFNLVHFLLWLSPLVQAQSTDADVIVALRKGAPAPFSGQLFDVDTAIRWGTWLENCRARGAADLDRSQKLCEVNLEHRDELAAIDALRTEAIIRDLEKRLLSADGARVKAEQERDNPAWHKTAWFGFTVGVVGTVGLIFVGSQAF